MTYSFDDFLHDVDAELLDLISKTTDDFLDYEFEADYHSQFPVALSAVEAIIQFGSISDLEIVDPNNICVYSSPYDRDNAKEYLDS